MKDLLKIIGVLIGGMFIMAFLLPILGFIATRVAAFLGGSL